MQKVLLPMWFGFIKYIGAKFPRNLNSRKKLTNWSYRSLLHPSIIWLKIFPLPWLGINWYILTRGWLSILFLLVTLVNWMINWFHLQRNRSLGFYHEACSTAAETGKEWRLQIHSFDWCWWCTYPRRDFNRHQIFKNYICCWFCFWSWIVWKNSWKTIWNWSRLLGQTRIRIRGKTEGYLLLLLLLFSHYAHFL